MLNPITLSKKQEYFIALAKQGAHSFIMLGAILDDGRPQLLARVGKWNLESSLITTKTLGKGVMARIKDEAITRKKEIIIPITYQAYSINYEQVLGFMSLIAEIDQEQMANKEITSRIVENEKNHYKQDISDKELLAQETIHCYVPTKTEGEQVTFEWKPLTNGEVQSSISPQQRKEAIDSAQRLSIQNTCRTTALNIVGAVLGFVTNISKYFFVSPSYKTTLDSGPPNKDSFYVLPPPPVVYKDTLSKVQNETLNKLYKRLEAIPKIKAASPETRKKFEALKGMYNEIAGANQLSANQLLSKILEHEAAKKDNLFRQREPSFFSRLFGIKTSTERFFKDVKSKLEKTTEPTNDHQAPDTPSLS